MENAEYRALTEAAGLLDLTRRGRLCLLGADREKFLHGQVTSDIVKLRLGQGSYGALVTAKGKLESDVFVYKLGDELLLDFEPGLSAKISERLQRFIIAEDVQVIDVSAIYSLLSIQGPSSESILRDSGFALPSPEPLSWGVENETYLVRNNRFGTTGFDLFVPAEGRADLANKLQAAGAARVSELAAEIVRIENGIPRFGVDMDESNLAPETGLERTGISYSKGCYIGQEVIARIRTYGQVAKALRVLRLRGEGVLPAQGTPLTRRDSRVGYTTSFVWSPKFGERRGLGYVRKEANAIGEKLFLEGTGEEVEIAALPFQS